MRAILVALGFAAIGVACSSFGSESGSSSGGAVAGAEGGAPDGSVPPPAPPPLLDGGAPSDVPLLWLKLDETSGTTAQSDGIAKLDGHVVSAAPGWTAGKVGGGFRFDGSSYIEINVLPPLTLTKQFTVALWYRPELAVDDERLFDFGGSFDLKLNGDPEGFFQLDFNSGYIGTTARLQNNVDWYHLAATCDDGACALYINGTHAPTSHDAFIDGGTVPAPQAKLVLGARWSYDMKAVGTIDDVRVYDRVLSSAEILALATP